jgi:hypothetical protein
MPKKKTEWQDYEKLIHTIYTELEPLADVRHNDFIEGIESGIKRQIDISVRTKVANHEILMIIQAKNLKHKADIKVIGEFDSVIRDVRASKGILICNAGFTNSAKEYAKKRKIDLYTAHDASVKEWQTEIQVPVIKRSIKVHLTVQHTYVAVGPTKIDKVKLELPVYALNEFLKKWENNEIPKTLGTHTMELEREAIKIHDDLLPLISTIKYSIVHRHHFKFFIPQEYRGLKDYITQKFKPSFIVFNEAIPFLNDGTWKHVEDIGDISLNASHLQIEIVEIDLINQKMFRAEWVDE